MGLRRVSRFIIKTPSGGTTGQVLTRDTGIAEGIKWADQTGGAGTLPSQTGNNGKYLTTDGTNASWADTPLEIPTQTGNAGKFLTTDGSAVSWADTSSSTSGFRCVLNQSGSAGLVLAPCDGNSVVIAGVARSLPAAGATYTISGSPSNGLYYVLASWNGSAVQLSIVSAASNSFQSTTYGFPVLSSDTSYTVVGAAYVHSNQFQFPNAISYSNPDPAWYGTPLPSTIGGLAINSLYNPLKSTSYYSTVQQTIGAINGGSAITLPTSGAKDRLLAVKPFILFAGQAISLEMRTFALTSSYWSITGSGYANIGINVWGTTATNVSTGTISIQDFTIGATGMGSTPPRYYLAASTAFNVISSTPLLYKVPTTCVIGASTVPFNCRICFLVMDAYNASTATITLGANLTNELRGVFI